MHYGGIRCIYEKTDKLIVINDLITRFLFYHYLM